MEYIKTVSTTSPPIACAIAIADLRIRTHTKSNRFLQFLLARSIEILCSIKHIQNKFHAQNLKIKEKQRIALLSFKTLEYTYKCESFA